MNNETIQEQLLADAILTDALSADVHTVDTYDHTMILDWSIEADQQYINEYNAEFDPYVWLL